MRKLHNTHDHEVIKMVNIFEIIAKYILKTNRIGTRIGTDGA